MVVTDLTYQLSPGMQLARQQQTVSQMQVQQDAASASRALEYQRAEAELQAAYDDLERTSSSYNELVDAYNAAERASEQASMDALIEERAAEYNAAVRRYNEAGNRYQNAGVITGFSAIEEFTPVKEERKPTLSALPQTQAQESDAEYLKKWLTTPLAQTAAENVEKSGFDIRDLYRPLYPGIISAVQETAGKLQENIVKANEPLLPEEEQKRLISNAQQSPQMIGTAGDVLKASVVSAAKPQEQRENFQYLTRPLLPRETQQAIISAVQSLPQNLDKPLLPREMQQEIIDRVQKVPEMVLTASSVAGKVFGADAANKYEASRDVVNFIQTPANASPEEQEALKQQRQDVVSGVLNAVFPLAPDNTVSAAADALTGKTDAQLQEEQRDYMTSLGKTQIALGSALSTVSPQVGQLLQGSGEEIFVSRDYQTEGLISTDGGMIKINRPSVYDTLAFGAALGAAGAAAGSGAVTGVSGFGKLFPKASTLTIEGAAVPTGYAVGGGSAGQALANAAAADTTAKTALAGASALGISLSEVDYGIGDLLDQYPRRDQEEDGRGFVIPGDVVIGNGVMDEYPPRSRYGSGSRYSRNNNNRNQNQDWNRSEIDYRGSVGSGYSTRLVEDSALRTRNQNQNRYRTEYDSVYEFAALTEVAPRARRSASWNDEEEDVIAPRKKQQKGKKKHFTERLIL